MAQFPGQRMGLGAGKKKKKSGDGENVVGKTPFMLLTEKERGVEKLVVVEEVAGRKPPWFRCSVTLNGVDFSGEGSSKKMAKHVMAQHALKAMGIDVNANYESKSELSTKDESMKMDEKTPIPASTLNELFQKCCQRQQKAENVTFAPEFQFTDVSVADAKVHEKKFKCTLLLPDQGKVYSVEGTCGKSVLKNQAIKEALRDLFALTADEIDEVERRGLRFSTRDPMTMVKQAAHQCNLQFDLQVETADGRELTNLSRFRATVTLGDRKFESVQISKMRAKESACIKALDELFGIHTETGLARKRANAANDTAMIAPAMTLHQLVQTQGGAMAEKGVVYEPAGEYKEKGVPAFRMRVLVGSTEFVGSGSSKKAAKNDAAMQALRTLFKFDLLEQRIHHNPGVDAKRLRKVDDAEELARFVHEEYATLCRRHGMTPASDLAAFVIRDTQTNALRLVSLAASGLDGGFAGSPETHLLDGAYLLDRTPAVLARRALNLFLLRQVAIDGDRDVEGVLERADDGRLHRLRPHLALHFFCTTPPNTSPLLDDPEGRTIQVLSCIRDGACLPAASIAQTMNELCRAPAIMSIADKMLKWNCLGIQGALLSTLIEPIFISSMSMGICDVSAVRHAVLERVPVNRSVELKSVSLASVGQDGGGVHWWNRTAESFESLAANEGRTVLGGCSRLSKTAIFEQYYSLVSTHNEYRNAKESAHIYMEAGKRMREELKRLSFGTWQLKPPQVDKFIISSSDG